MIALAERLGLTSTSSGAYTDLPVPVAGTESQGSALRNNRYGGVRLRKSHSLATELLQKMDPATLQQLEALTKTCLHGIVLHTCSTCGHEFHNRPNKGPVAGDSHPSGNAWSQGSSNARSMTASSSNDTRRLGGGGGVSSEDLEKVQAILDGVQTVEERSMFLYKILSSNDLPNFCKDVQLDQDGGLDRLETLWTWQKHIWAAFLFASVCFNLFLLINMNMSIVKSFMLNYMKRYAYRPQAFLASLGTDFKALVVEDTYTSNHTKLGQHGALTASLMAEDARDMFDDIQDPETRMIVATLASLVALFEVSGIFFYLLSCVRHLLVFNCSTEYKAFIAIDNLFQHTLPSMSTFSMIHLFGAVHPSLLYTKYVNLISESAWGDSTGGIVVLSIYFVLSRLLCAALAIASFCLKLLAVAFKMLNPKFHIVMRFLAALALMNQCVGCVLFERVLQDRLFLFIFGGTDAQYQDDELALRNVYRCRLSREIWIRYWQKGECLKAISWYATFDHYDMQALLLETTAQRRNQRETTGELIE